MAWMVSVILITFYVLGSYAFQATGLIRVLPYLAALILIVDFLLARALKQRSSVKSDSA